MRIRFEAGLPHQDSALDAALASLLSSPPDSVPRIQLEMETGTGKTYVYLRLVHELRARRGWSKFIVVVPSIAIREGVLAAVRATDEHFAELYGGRSIRAEAYASRDIGAVRDFAAGPDLQLLVINIDAFNKDTNLIHQAHDAFLGQRPIDLLRSTRPVVLVDEPQRFATDRAQAAIAGLHPRAVIGWSATPPSREGLVFRLTPDRAFEAGLVKSIDVAAHPGSVEARVRCAIRIGLEKERWIRQRRAGKAPIKVLSLFFVDRVADYDHPEGLVRRAIDDAWEEERASGEWEDLDLPPSDRVHRGFFARSKAGASRDTRGRSEADRRAYELILRDKEGLLDPREPLRLIVSHSALREGWDNPNIFVLCALNHARSTTRRRQELGRGLRLPVDAAGRRVRDPEITRLTVVADEEYESFADSLQREYRESSTDVDFSPAHDHWSRREFLPDHARLGNPWFTNLWDRVSREFRWTSTLDPTRLEEEAAARLSELSERSSPSDPSVPDLLTLLSDKTELCRERLANILSGAGVSSSDARRCDFIDRAAAAIADARDSLLVSGLRWEVGEPDLTSGARWATEVRAGYGSSIVPTTKSIYEAIPTRARWEADLVRSLEASEDVMFMVRLPDWLVVETPVGGWSPTWGLVLRDGRCIVVDCGAVRTPRDRLRLEAGRGAMASVSVSVVDTRDPQEALR